MMDEALHVLWLEIVFVAHDLFKSYISDGLQVGIVDFADYHNCNIACNDSQNVGLACQEEEIHDFSKKCTAKLHKSNK